MADVQARPFGVRFHEAIDFLNCKLPEASVAWDDLAGPVHAKVFTVAGATTADLARDLQQALTDALQQGTTITDFRKRFDAIVHEHGWTYRGKRGWRTRVIFDANMRSAHMAGRWEQLQANKEQRPFLQYRTAGDARVRPQHRAWDRKIYPIDDAFWQTHYPPNGWGCRCTVRAYSQRELDRKGLGLSAPTPIQMRDVITRDGEIKDRVPVGIDPGWDHNVGQSWISPELALGRKLARLPRELQGPVVDKTISPAFQQVLSERWKAAQSVVKATSQVVGYTDSATLRGLADHAPDAQIDSAAMTARPGSVPSDLDLPDALRNYRAVMWDKVAGELVVMPTGTRQALRLRPGPIGQLGSSLEVTGTETAKAADFPADRYVILSGRLAR